MATVACVSSSVFVRNVCGVKPFNMIVKLHIPSIVCSSSNSKKNKTNMMDDILDYIQGGPKLRKWYGAPDQLLRDGNGVSKAEEDDSPEAEEIRDAVLVTDGNSEIGQMVILSLIIKRARVKAIVKDRRDAIEAFGTYVQSIAEDRNDPLFVRKALRGVRAIICPSNEGFLSNIGNMEGVQHIVLLSQLAAYRGNNGIMAFIESGKRKLAEKDEIMVMDSGIPHTIIRAGLLENTPGGKQGFNFKKGCASQGKLSKEDAAFICVEALDAIPGSGLVLEVTNGDENVSNWKEWFTSLIQRDENV